MAKQIYLGVPKSLKHGDNRVAVPPKCIQHLRPAAWNNGREETELTVLVEQGAGERSGFSDRSYLQAGAHLVTLAELLDKAHIMVDVKQRPKEGILENGVNLFYAHVEKGQGVPQLRDLLEAKNVTAYSPETFWLNDLESRKPIRGTNLGFFSGIGSVHLLFEGIRISYERRGESTVPFASFPKVHGATEPDILQGYTRMGSLEKALRFAIIGGQNGLVSRGAQREFARAGVGFDILYRDVTGNPDVLAERLAEYDGIVNATVWNPGDQRIITRRQIQEMKTGAVFIDNTCDIDKSSTATSDGSPVVGGVRYSFESRWGDPSTFYWVGQDNHTFVPAEDQKQAEYKDETHPVNACSVWAGKDQQNVEMDPRKFSERDVKVLYNVIGMIPGGTSTAKAASEAYFGMVFPYLTAIIRAVSQGAELPENGMVVKEGRIHHPQLRECVETEERLAEFQQYL